MSNTENLYREVELELNREDGLDLIILLDESSPLPNCSGYYEILYTNPEEDDWPADGSRFEERYGDTSPGDFPNSDVSRVILYFPADEIACVANVELLLAARGITEFRLREKFLGREDYMEAYKEFYHPIPVGEGMAIIPSWYRGTPEETEFLKDNVRPLYLDPGLAFGTGKHPTTRLCLTRMQAMDIKDARILDAGCGSGVLAIGALILGAAEAKGFDVDGNAIRASAQNLEHQPEYAGRLTVEQGGFEVSMVSEYDADLMVGNLTETVILANSKAIRGGRFRRMLFSGILSEQGENIIEHFADAWELVHRLDLEGWCALELKKK